MDVVRRAALHVPLHAFRESVGLDCCAQRGRVDAGLSAPALETSLIELVVVREQSVVHDPERVGTGERVYRLYRFGRHLRVGMDFAEGEVAKLRSKGVRLKAPEASERQLEAPVWGHS